MQHAEDWMYTLGTLTFMWLSVLASRFVTDSLLPFAFATYVLVVVVLFIAAIAFVSIAPSLVAIAVVVAVGHESVPTHEFEL